MPKQLTYAQFKAVALSMDGLHARIRPVPHGKGLQLYLLDSGIDVVTYIHPGTDDWTDYSAGLGLSLDSGRTSEGYLKAPNVKAGPQPIAYAMDASVFELPTDADAGRDGTVSKSTNNTLLTITANAQDGQTPRVDNCYVQIMDIDSFVVIRPGYELKVEAGTDANTLKITYNGGTPVDNVDPNTTGVVVNGGAAGQLTLSTGNIPGTLPQSDWVKVKVATSKDNPLLAYVRWDIPEILRMGGIAASWQNVPRFTRVQCDTGFYFNQADETTFYRLGGFTMNDGISLAGTFDGTAAYPPGGGWTAADIFPTATVPGIGEVELFIRLAITRNRACETSGGNEIRPYVDLDFDLTRSVV
jgi:hypothetical protein